MRMFLLLLACLPGLISLPARADDVADAHFFGAVAVANAHGKLTTTTATGSLMSRDDAETRAVSDCLVYSDGAPCAVVASWSMDDSGCVYAAVGTDSKRRHYAAGLGETEDEAYAACTAMGLTCESAATSVCYLK